jgi:putative ABC transport system permease protein
MSFVRLMQADKGFDTASVLTVDVALPTTTFPASTEQLRFYDAAIARLRAVPGVTSVAFTSRLPLRGEGTVNLLSYQNDTRPLPARPLANYRYVTPEYFATIGTPLLRGRTFRETDRGRQVVILSASAAHALWPGEDAVGKQVKTGGYLGAVSEVIGVAADTRAVDLTRTDVLFTYLPYWLRGASSASLVLRASVPPASLGDTVRRAIRDVDAGVAIPRVETMGAAVALSVADRRFQLELMIAFGGAAALLTAFGVFGVVSYSVARREREMGIRIALGAAPRHIQRLVITEGVLPVVAGLGVGLVLSGWIGSALAASLFAVRAGDPLVLGAATLTLLLATFAACAGPAIRATRISPVGSLRA